MITQNFLHEACCTPEGEAAGDEFMMLEEFNKLTTAEKAQWARQSMLDAFTRIEVAGLDRIRAWNDPIPF